MQRALRSYRHKFHTATFARTLAYPRNCVSKDVQLNRGHTHGSALPPSRNGGSSSGDDQVAHDPTGIRLQKVLAQAGVGSRRACEQLIREGRVQVNGKTVAEIGIRVDPSKVVSLCVDGKEVHYESESSDRRVVTLAFHKPAGVVSAMSCSRGRKHLGDFTERIPTIPRVFHVGRLDFETEGLLLLTNDGELSHRLMHPRFQVPKKYVIEVRGPVAANVEETLRNGVELEDGPAAADSICRLEESGNRVVFEMVLHEGRKRIVRRMFDAVRHPVLRLIRTSFGTIQLGNIAPGSFRHIEKAELRQLKAMVNL